MIRRTLRFGIRLGLFAGIGLALFKLIQGRRSAAEYGTPSADWAPPPSPNPNLPKSPPEPELVKPAMLEEVIEKKAAVLAIPSDLAAPGIGSPDSVAPDVSPAPPVEPFGAELTVENTPAPKQVAVAKSVPTATGPAAAGPVKKVAPPKKVAAKKAAPSVAAPSDAAPPAAEPVAKKAAPVKKAPKKSQP